MRNRLLATIMAVVLAISVILPSMDAHADTELPTNIQVSIDGTSPVNVRGLTIGYDDNNYVSIMDMMRLFEGTDREFKVSITGDTIQIEAPWVQGKVNAPKTEDESGETNASGESADDDEAEALANSRSLDGWSADEKSAFVNKSLGLNNITVNGETRRYYTIMEDVGDITDIFINITDFALLFDTNITIVSEDSYEVDTHSAMAVVNPLVLESYGYFQGVNSVLVGDITTGEVYYGYNTDKVYPIASTTKIMTLLLAMEALDSGSLTLDERVEVDSDALAMSQSSDGVTPLKSGQKLTVDELMRAAMIVSSNECTHMLGCRIGGDEESFVAMMNNKAAELGMNTAEYYNCNGLPLFTETMVAAKKQNRMSSHDMFTLVSYVINNHPEIRDITSTQKTTLETLDQEIKNTNPALYNVPETNGLKTGTTTKSGACLVTTLTVSDGTVDHDLVVILFGAETNQDRGRVSELMARYARGVVRGEAEKVSGTGMTEDGETGIGANALVNMVVNSALKSGR